MSEREREMIAAIADIEEDETDEPVVEIAPPDQPSQVYSIRMPIARVEQLRKAASTKGVAPTQLMRQWVIERLDSDRPQGTPTSLIMQVKVGRATDITESVKRYVRVTP